MTAPLLEATSIRRTFAGVHALKGVSLNLFPGEVHALIGENGAGKSTLIKILSGAEQPDSGTIALAGQQVSRIDPHRARGLGIVVIHQQPLLFPDLTVAENIAWTLEASPLWRTIDGERRLRVAKELIERTGGTIDPGRLAGSLSMPEQQVVEIAKAIGANAKIVIMDEPTASLTSREVTRLFEVIRSLRANGVGIIYISHRLEEISEIADRITVLRDGETIATRAAKDVERSELIELMVGRSVTAIFPKRKVEIGSVVLEIRNLTSQAAGLYDVSFSLRQGEILGLAGLSGSGRTQLAETLFGLTPGESGEILLNGVCVEVRTPQQAIQSGIAYVPEDRRQHGVVLEMPIAANASLASLKAVSKHGFILSDREQALARQYIGRLRIKAASASVAAGTLSGGNQQKVALARWLATNPEVLILDEPTQGVDVGSKAEIHSLMMDLAESGLAILMISSELPEILGMSDRIAVMNRGRISGLLSREEATQAKILELAIQR